MFLLASFFNPEEHIVSFLKNQDPQALKLIQKHYGRAMCGIIHKVVQHEALTQDAWQESLVKMWKASEAYDPQKGRLFTWMVNICRRTAIDKTRSKDYRIEREIRNPDTFVYLEMETTESIQPDHIGLKEMVDGLDPKLKEVLNLVYFGGRTHQEAAEELDMPLGTLKTRVRNGLLELRKIFGQ